MALDTSMTLQAELAINVGASAHELRLVYARHSRNANFMDHALEAAKNPVTAVTATWIVKWHLDNGFAPCTGQQIQILALLKQSGDWQARLHILQCLQYVRVPYNLSQTTFDTLLALIQDKNRFVRAWAYNGLHIVGMQHGEFYQRAMTHLESALGDEAPSVRARIRKILK